MDYGFHLDASDYKEILSYCLDDNYNAIRLVRERASRDGFEIVGIPTKAEQLQGLENHYTALRDYINTDDPMRRRYPDDEDITNMETSLTGGLSIKRIEVYPTPKTLEEIFSQDLRYQNKMSALDFNEEHPFHNEILEAMFDRDEQRAKTLLGLEQAYKTETDKKQNELKERIIECLTDDMRADISWMRVYKNADPGGEITDSELSWVTSPEYREMYDSRSKEHGKESDYPEFLREYKPVKETGENAV